MGRHVQTRLRITGLLKCQASSSSKIVGFSKPWNLPKEPRTCPQEACNGLVVMKPCSVSRITHMAPQTPCLRPLPPQVPCILLPFFSSSIPSSRKPFWTPRVRDPSLGFHDDKIFICRCPFLHIPPLPPAMMELVAHSNLCTQYPGPA